MKIFRPIVDTLAAVGATVFALILLFRIAAPRTGQIEFQWPAPTSPIPGSSSVFNANEPARTLRVNSDGFDWCVYYPLKFPDAMPPERLYLPLGKPDSPYETDWTNVPNPALQEFRKQHPPRRKVWQ